MEKYCKNCGNPLNEKGICTNCNIKNDNNYTNICALIGFILSLLSICCCGITSVISLGFSIVGLLNSKNDNNGTGKNFAIAGIIISSIFILILLIFYVYGITTSIIGDINNSYSGADFY